MHNWQCSSTNQNDDIEDGPGDLQYNQTELIHRKEKEFNAKVILSRYVAIVSIRGRKDIFLSQGMLSRRAGPLWRRLLSDPTKTMQKYFCLNLELAAFSEPFNAPQSLILYSADLVVFCKSENSSGEILRNAYIMKICNRLLSEKARPMRRRVESWTRILIGALIRERERFQDWNGFSFVCEDKPSSWQLTHTVL